MKFPTKKSLLNETLTPTYELLTAATPRIIHPCMTENWLDSAEKFQHAAGDKYQISEVENVFFSFLIIIHRTAIFNFEEITAERGCCWVCALLVRINPTFTLPKFCMCTPTRASHNNCGALFNILREKGQTPFLTISPRKKKILSTNIKSPLKKYPTIVSLCARSLTIIF